MARLNLNLLLILDAVLKERSVSRAAKRLGLSQPAISNALRRLRDVFDDELLIRSPHGLAPTPRGWELAASIGNSLDQLRGVMSRSQFEPGTTERTFIVLMFDSISGYLLPRLMSRVSRESPGMRLEIRPNAFGRIAGLLDIGEIDLAIGPAYQATGKGLQNCLLSPERFLCLTGRDHPGIKDKLSLEDYLAYSHVDVRMDAARDSIFDASLRVRGLTRRISLNLSNPFLVPPVLQNTDLIFTCSAKMASIFLETHNLRVSQLPFDVISETRLIWHERMQKDAGNMWLRALIQECWQLNNVAEQAVL